MGVADFFLFVLLIWFGLMLFGGLWAYARFRADVAKVRMDAQARQVIEDAMARRRTADRLHAGMILNSERVIPRVSRYNGTMAAPYTAPLVHRVRSRADQRRKSSGDSDGGFDFVSAVAASSDSSDSGGGGDGGGSE